jgi:putative transcriptional regulator
MKKSILEVVHASAKDLHDIGLMDMKTLRTFDTLCLTPASQLTPGEIKRIRLREKISQPIFAACLNASASTVKKWETGEKHPTGPALRLLNVIAEKGLQAIL